MNLITFAGPKKVKMASGCERLELTEEGTWESFPPFAEKYVAQIGAKILKRIEAPDMHLWEIEYDGAILNFVYSDYPNGVSIEPKDKDGQAAVDKLFGLVVGQSEPNGL
jgi:hypothetical protein